LLKKISNQNEFDEKPLEAAPTLALMIFTSVLADTTVGQQLSEKVLLG